MTVKKKLGMGVLSAALGLSLVGGGTYAAFNDTATVNNHFAAGELDLEVGKSGSKPINFDLSNMKPGDNVQRIFKLNNAGSLAIKEVLLNTTAANFEGNGDSNRGEFLSQFEIDFMQVDGESTNWEPRNNVVKSGETLTLQDLVTGNHASKIKSDFLASDGSERINLAPLTVASGAEAERGLPADPNDKDEVFIQITFKDDTTRVGGNYSEFVQNKYMNDSVDFFFNLEATQWDGVHVDTPNGNGEINNDVQGSADGSNMPSPVTEGSGKHTTDVED